MAEILALPDLLRQAGAVMTQRGGRAAPAHYGSAASELAVCVAGVGLADRSDLGVLSIAASHRGLDHLLARVVGHGISPSGAVLQAGAWWCRSASGDEVVVICPYARAARVEAALRHDVDRLTSGTLTDLSESRFVLNVLGRRAGAVLADLGVYGRGRDPRDASPFIEAPVGAHQISWLLETPTSALAIVDSGSAGEVWRAVEAAGRPYGMSCVGLDSIDRYLLAERTKRRTATLL
jgi:glycine cleavage system aminomethyltransferase T